jgi:hypothetical protein
MHGCYFNIQKYYTDKMYLQVHPHVTSPFYALTIIFLYGVPEIFNKGAISLEERLVYVCAKPQITWS